jgi:hypothetical protein
MLTEGMRPKGDLSREAFKDAELDQFLDRLPSKTNDINKASSPGSKH